jgi:type I restriction enzyme S subunit
MSWEIKQFKDVVQFPPKINFEKGESYSFIPMEDLSSGIKYVSPKIEKVWSGSGGAKFEEGDTLFARITPCLQNGKISQAKNLKNGKGFGSTEYFIFRGIENVSDSDFIYYFSLNEEFKKYAIGSMVGASGRQRADQKFVGEFEINLPPLETQKRIASILSNYDDLIENNLKRIKLLEETAQNIYKEWFVNFRFPNYEHTDFNSESGLPVGWVTKKVTDFFEFIKGIEVGSANYEKESNIEVVPFLRVGDISKRDGGIYVKKSLVKDKFVEKNDILISFDGSIGSVGYGLEGSYSSGLRKITTKTEIFGKGFMYCLVKSDNIQNTIGAHAKGTTILHAGTSIIHLEFLLATDNVILSFNQIANPIFEQMVSLNHQNQKLKEARDILLPRLMNRTIEV